MKKHLLIALLSSASLWAQSGASGVFTFLDRSVFAGASALGNTGYVHPGRVGAYAIQNPLLLSDSSMHQIELSRAGLGEGIALTGASYGFKWKGRHLMTAIQSVGYGTFEGTDVWGNPQGEFQASDLALSLGTSLFSYGDFELGTTLKWVSGTYESYQSNAAALDLVAMYRHADRPTIAFIAKNVGAQITTFSGTREPLPLNLLLAVGNKLKYAPFRWTFVVDQLQRPNLGYDDPTLIETDPVTGEQTQGKPSFLNLAMRHVSGSIEFEPTQRMHFMMGYSFRRQYEMGLPDRRTSGGFTLGTGLYFSKFSLHYANELRSVAGRMNTVSLSVNL